jgi:quercetin dioxygenase-like cupin family protein
MDSANYHWVANIVINALPKYKVVYDGAVLNIYHCDVGQGLPRHTHKHAHLTVCHAGSCIIRKENRELVMTKNTQPVNLTENEWHEIEALEDGTVFVNVFAEGKI